MPILTRALRLPHAQFPCRERFPPTSPNAKCSQQSRLPGDTGPRLYPDKLEEPAGPGGDPVRVHIFIFVRRCDLHFTLLLDLFRQVKANELLMNKSVKYSPPAQLLIRMLLIAPVFVLCSATGCRKWVFKQGASADIKYPRARVAAGKGQGKGILGTPDFPAWSPEPGSLELA